MAERSGRWAVIVHGGAKTITLDRENANRRGCLAAVEAGAMVLRTGGGAVQAVEAAVRMLENDVTFNAGYGSVLNADGDVEMDAALMDGETLNIGALAAVRRLRNPITAARTMLGAKPVLLVAEGAEQFAAERGIPLCDPGALRAPEIVASGGAGHDTVGCVALDLAGHFAAATSTGGLSGTCRGRVGDSPIPGCGLYADDLLGAVSLSGDGESILRTMLAARVIHALDGFPASRAAEVAIGHLSRIGGEAGAIVLDRDGRVGVAHNSDHFAVAFAASDVAPRAALHRDELEDILHG